MFTDAYLKSFLFPPYYERYQLRFIVDKFQPGLFHRHSLTCMASEWPNVIITLESFANTMTTSSLDQAQMKNQVDNHFVSCSEITHFVSCGWWLELQSQFQKYLASSMFMGEASGSRNQVTEYVA